MQKETGLKMKSHWLTKYYEDIMYDMKAVGNLSSRCVETCHLGIVLGRNTESLSIFPYMLKMRDVEMCVLQFSQHNVHNMF